MPLVSIPKNNSILDRSSSFKFVSFSEKINWKGNKEFENHRKAHYNEFKMAQLLRNRMDDDDDEDEEGVNDNGNETDNRHNLS